jgi:signal peptidase I
MLKNLKKKFKVIENKIQTEGWVNLSSCYSKILTDKIRKQLFNKIKFYKDIQDKNNLKGASNNTMHHILLVCPITHKLLNPNPIHKFLEYYFEGKYILNTMGATFVKKDEKVYTQKIHRDVRSFSNNKKIMLIAIILLDDSNEKNGATWILSGNFKTKSKPTKKYFYNNADRIIGKKGDVILFNGNLWHASGKNITQNPRVIVTAAFTRPYIKQGLDYPRALGLKHKEKLDDNFKQILGYNAMTPNNLDEFYKPKHLRFYKSDQG